MMFKKETDGGYIVALIVTWAIAIFMIKLVIGVITY